MNFLRRLAAPAALSTVVGGLALPAAADIPIRAQRVASGISQPLFVTAAPGDASRLFVVSKSDGGSSASIRILDLNTNTLSGTPFLTVTGLTTAGESGLLGLAFHPDWGKAGSPNKDHFYVRTVVPGGSLGNLSQVQRYTRSASNPNAADAASKQVVLSYDQPLTNHAGGWLAFSPIDKYLYLATGDGGNRDDTGTGHTAGIGNAQDTDKLSGKVLRIDVNGDDFPTDVNRNYAIPRGGAGNPPKNPFAPAVGAPTNPAGADEVWSYGVRNPWRSSFDRKTGDLWIGDVGQDLYEEIDFQPANSAGGENYGWRAMEGKHPTGLTPVLPGMVDPIHEYGRTLGRSVTGGYVYRGPENPALEGTYIFGDFVSARIFSLRYDPGTKTVYDYRELKNNVTGGPRIPTDIGTIDQIASFGEDALGRLYVVDHGGEVFRLIPALQGDADLDGLVDFDDFRRLYDNFDPLATGRTWAQGDFNDDHVVNFTDYQILERNFGRAVPFGTLPDGTPVPEPAGVVGVAVGAAASMIARRRRRRP